MQRLADHDRVNRRVRQRNALGRPRKKHDLRQGEPELGKHLGVRLDRDDVYSEVGQVGGELAGPGAQIQHSEPGMVPDWLQRPRHCSLGIVWPVGRVTGSLAAERRSAAGDDVRVYLPAI